MPGETSISPNKKVVNPPRFFANSSFQTVDFIEHISFKTFNEGTHLVSSVQLVQELFHTKLKLLGAMEFMPQMPTESIADKIIYSQALSEKDMQASMKAT